MVAVISNYFSVHEQGEKNWSKYNIRFWWHGTGWKLIPSHKTCVVPSCYRTCVEQIFPTLFWFLCEMCYSINDDLTLRLFWFKFAIFYQTGNDTNLMRHGAIAEFLFGIFIVDKRCVCSGWLGCAENKSCLKKYFVMSVGWMCVKMNEDIVEIIAAEILKRFWKYVW